MGHAAIHCPHPTQLVSPSPISNAEPINVANPRLFGPMTPTDWTFSQTAEHLRQRMHLLLSPTMEGELIATFAATYQGTYLQRLLDLDFPQDLWRS